MRLIDLTIRHVIPALGIANRWLKEELQARGVLIPVQEACLREFVSDAELAARSQADALGAYSARLRSHIAATAEFLRCWTQSDARIATDDPKNDRFVKVARNFALPRPWKLTEPVASESRRRVPSYVHWARAG